MGERKKQQADLLRKLGLLLAPLQNVVDYPGQHDSQARAKACAKFCADDDTFRSTVSDFTESESGHRYDRERSRINRALSSLNNSLKAADNSEELGKLLDYTNDEITDAILTIPVSIDSEILDAHTPFSTYCTLKDLYQTTVQRLIYVDRYTGASIFYRYLRDLPASVSVTLLTWPDNKRNKEEFIQFMDASKLYADELCDPDKYSLIVNAEIHDRWLCCDGQVYTLGPSIRDAGGNAPATLSKLGPNNLQKIEQLLNSGQEIYGPNQPNHP